MIPKIEWRRVRKIGKRYEKNWIILHPEETFTLSPWVTYRKMLVREDNSGIRAIKLLY